MDSQQPEVLTIGQRVGWPRRKAGFFIDEVDAAFGAGGDWHPDPDGDDGDAGVVI